MKKLYLYIRLSDADDDLKFKTESESIANQRTLLYRFIRARREFDGYEVVEFIDATDIIGLKQNPTYGRRFSPIFLIYRAFCGAKRKMLL